MRMAILISMVVAALMAGCNEAQQTKVWGQGNPPATWQGFFGNDNSARLDYVQTQSINRQGQVLAELVERVRKLEEPIDPNE